MNRGVDLTTRLRGYNVRQVDEYLENLRQTYAERIALLKQQIEDSMKEKERLYDKLIKLQNEKEKQQRSKDFFDLALVRAKEAVSFFESKAGEEASDIIHKAKQQNEDNEYKINDIDNEIKLTRMRVESLLQDMMKILQESSPEKDNDKEETGAGKVVGKIFPVTSKSKGLEVNGKLPAEKKNNQAGQAKRDMVEDADSLSTEQDQKMTADGAVPVDNQHNRLVEKITAAEEFKKERPPEKTGGEGFWEECSDAPALERETPEVLIPPVIDIGNYIKKKEIDILAVAQETPAQGETAAAVEELLGEPAVQTPAGCTQEEDSSGNVPSESSSQAGHYSLGRSPAVAAEISSIRYKYIVGKLAGEDLLDGNGKLIIAKNEKISPEIVALAEAEGKLPELIVNMIIPGMEE